jgi:Raf kinase inhibitor-like YbhB/YbcL family protein
VHVHASITVDSPDIAEGGRIPARYTCDGQDVSPPLRWSGVPSDAAALALVVDDPDAPRGTYTHWVVVDIDPAVKSVARGQSPPGAQQIANSAGRASYIGPCPPSDVHHYRFTMYALSRRLALPACAALEVRRGHVTPQNTAGTRQWCIGLGHRGVPLVEVGGILGSLQWVHGAGVLLDAVSLTAPTA